MRVYIYSCIYIYICLCIYIYISKWASGLRETKPLTEPCGCSAASPLPAPVAIPNPKDFPAAYDAGLLKLTSLQGSPGTWERQGFKGA